MKSLVPLLLVASVVVGFIVSCSKTSKMTEEQLFGLAKAQESKEQFKDAAKTYEALVKRYPEGKHGEEALYRLGLIYANNLHDYRKAVGAYKRLIEKYPNSPRLAQAYFMIGYHYANDIKDLDKAREAYNTFLEKFPNHELAASVKFELKYLGKDVTDLDIFQEGNTESGDASPTSSGGGR